MEETRRGAESKGLACWQNCKERLLDYHLNVDRIFYRIGLSIGTRPWLWLIASICISCICGPGLIFWKEEVDDIELFMPRNSVVRRDAAWVKEHFRDDVIYESIIVTAPNVLEPEVLRLINEIENGVKSTVVNNVTWQDVCARYLTWFGDGDATGDSEGIEYFEEVLKNLNNTMTKDGCVYQSLTRIWESIMHKDISNLSRTEILSDVTAAMHDETNKNLLFDVAPLLSGVEYDEEGRVKSARATMLNWMLKRSNPNSHEWELGFIDTVLQSNRTLPANTEVYAVATRSFKDFLREIVNSNISVLFCGLSLIAIYVISMISRCNLLEQRIYLSLLGVSVVGQAILSSYGICYYMGYFYGPVHPILPFLLLGIGVDDMFVIMQCLENCRARDKNLDVAERIAKSLQQSGMSITVTSITNLVAFAIGISTIMPFLRSFCMFATMAILFLYTFEITFFVSCLVYDERRVEARRDGCCCRPITNWKPNECSQKNIQQMIFENYVGPFIMKPIVKIVVLVITVCLVCVNTWATFQLDQNFDPLWYLNQDSYPIQFNNKLTEYFPESGKHAGIYMSGVDYYEDRHSLIQLVDVLSKNPFINNRTLEAWFVAYENWLNRTEKGSDIESSDEYYNVFAEFLLLTKEGQVYIKDIKFDKIPVSDYNITTSQIQIQHKLINTTTDQVQAMQSVRDAVQATNFSRGHDRIAIFSQEYVTWTANKIIGEELIRNLSLEMIAIGLVTLLLLRNLQASFWVICCVIFTLVDLLGSMHFLGLTIEISSSIMVLLCAGLAVDYAAHVGLEFTRANGTKNERAITTLSIIGPPVFNGGLSTFLAFALLGTSKAYIFKTFFKLFTAVVIFGLFHGLIFLPITLSILGPNERKTEIVRKEQMVQEHNGYYTVHLRHSKEDGGGDLAK